MSWEHVFIWSKHVFLYQDNQPSLIVKDISVQTHMSHPRIEGTVSAVLSKRYAPRIFSIQWPIVPSCETRQVIVEFDSWDRNCWWLMERRKEFINRLSMTCVQVPPTIPSSLTLDGTYFLIHDRITAHLYTKCIPREWAVSQRSWIQHLPGQQRTVKFISSSKSHVHQQPAAVLKNRWLAGHDSIIYTGRNLPGQSYDSMMTIH